MKKIAIILLIIILAFTLWRIFDLTSYLVHMTKWEREKTKIELNAQNRDKWFAELDSISSLILEKEYVKALAFTDNFYETDTNRIDLLLKCACIDICLQNEDEAIKVVNRIKSKISYKLGTAWIINNKEIMYYALLSESVIMNKNLDSMLTEYSLSRKKEWILNNMDSIITKQIYEK
jgi:hypothetical protein